MFGGPKKDRLFWLGVIEDLLGAGVLGDSLGALRDGVLGELTGEEEPDSGLDFAGVHDGHGLGGDSGVGVDLLQHLVDVDSVGLLPLSLLLLLVTLGDGLGGLAGLLGSFS